MLTAKQAECLTAIERHIANTGTAPSYEELGRTLGQRSKSGVHRLILALEERGSISGSSRIMTPPWNHK